MYHATRSLARTRLLALVLLAPFAACRHGGDGPLAADSPAEERSAPPLAEVAPRPAPSPARSGTAGFRLFAPPPHRHSGAPASTHTFHLFTPRHR
jgi:hypothetical protein